MPGWTRVILSRIVAAGVGGVVGWLGTKGVSVSHDAQTSVVGWIVGVGLPLAGYGVTHKLIDTKTNPGDTASGTLARESVKARAVAKAREI